MEVIFANEKYEVDIDRSDGTFNAVINGEKHALNGRAANKNTFLFQSENKVVNVYAAEDDDHYYAFIEGEAYTFEKVKEEEKSFEADAGSSDREEIFPPMPGSVVKVVAEKGQKVAEGDALIIVEAMKMETSLYASIDGVVTEINVEAGQQVGSDDILIVVEKEEE